MRNNTRRDEIVALVPVAGTTISAMAEKLGLGHKAMELRMRRYVVGGHLFSCSVGTSIRIFPTAKACEAFKADQLAKRHPAKKSSAWHGCKAVVPKDLEPVKLPDNLGDRFAPSSASAVVNSNECRPWARALTGAV